MDRMDINAGFQTRVDAERAALVTSGDVAEVNGVVCPGTNIKVGDDVNIQGVQVVRVIGGNTADSTYFYGAYMDWTIANSFTSGTFPGGSINDQTITDRAPVDPEDEDPIYIDPNP